MKYLLKQAFKSLFNSKIFAIIIMIVTFLTGGVYTLLISTSNSFTASYKAVVGNAHLADAIVKLNLKFDDSQDDLYFKSVGETSAQSKPTGILTNNLKANPLTLKDNVYSIQAELVGTGHYAELNKTRYSFSEDITQITSLQKEQQFRDDFTNYLGKAIDNIRNKAKRDQEVNYATNLEKAYDNKFVAQTTQSLTVTNDKNAYKVVRLNSEKKSINDLVVYDGTDQFIPEISTKDLKDELIKRMIVKISNEQGALISNQEITKRFSFNLTKGYRVTAVSANNEKAFKITDPSSLQAIVSTSWANLNNKKAITIDQLKEIYGKVILDNKEKGEFTWTEELIKQYHNNIVKVDSTPYFITGIGQTPDFAFPIIDVSRPLPKTNDEAIVFVSNSGYNRIIDGFRTNPTEDYVSIRFKANIDSDQQKQIIAQMNRDLIQQDTKNNLPVNKWPGNIKIVTPLKDSTNSEILAPERVNFLTKMQTSIDTLNYLTTTFLVLFVFSIISMVFFALISSKRKVFATLLAQGYNKHLISFSIAIVSILLVAVPSILGYIVGFGSQYALINVLSSTWTIPTYGDTFSWLSFIIVVTIPIISIFLLVFIVSEVVLKGKVTTLLNDSRNSNSSVVAFFMKPFGFVGTKTKYMLTLVFKNSHRLILVTLISIISAISIIISLSSFNVAQKAYTSTINKTSWEYKVNLYSPTDEGGLYSSVRKSHLANIKHRETYKQNDNDEVIKNPHWHIAGTGDAGEQKQPRYLKNKIQTEFLLRQSGKTAGISPWKIASSLMPDNQLNKAEANFKEIQKMILSKMIPSNNSEEVKRNMFFDLLKQGKINPYLITYKINVLDDSDEIYTYLDTLFTSSKDKYKIIGLKDHSHYVNLNDNIWHTLNTYQSKQYKPLIINRYIAKKFRLSSGSIVDTDILNNTKRLTEEDKEKIKIKFKVIQVINTFNDGGLYTSQKVANSILDLNDKNNNSGYNGVFIKNKNSTFLNSIPLYSPSGFYPSTDTINEAWVQQNLGKNSEESKKFIDKYGINPYVSAFKDFGWRQADRYTFKNISRISSDILNFIEGISLTISILFVILVTVLMVNSNKKKISTLWTLGYRKREISRIFIGIYILPILFTILFATLGSYFIIQAVVWFIMGFGHILIPITMLWWIPIVAIAIIFTIIGISVFVSINKLSNQHALLAFKGED